MVEAKTGFDYKELLTSVKDLKDSLPNVAPEPFYKTLLEFVKIFDFMGSGLQMAFKDITSKVGIVKRNFDNHKDAPRNIMGFINWEADKKIQILNGENGKLAPEPVWMGYESTTRTVLRLMWFFDFVTIMVTNLNNDRKAKVSECCKKAYDDALGPHHPFTIRAAAKTAMTFAPNREKLMNNLFPPGVAEEDRYTALQELLDNIAPIRTHLWDHYNKNSLTTLP